MLYQLNPLYEMTYERYVKAFNNRDKSRDTARGLDRSPLFKTFKGDKVHDYNTGSFAKISKNRIGEKIGYTTDNFKDSYKDMQNSLYNLNNNELLDKPLSKVTDRQQWIKERKNKIRNKKLALIGLGIAGTGALGYGAYKLLNRKKDEEDNEE